MSFGVLAKYSVLGVRISAATYGSAADEVLRAARAGHALTVTALAVHGVMTGFLDKVHRYRLNRFDLVCPDGQPVRGALNLLHGTGLKDRVYGPDLALCLCEAAAREGLPVYFYGSRPEVLSRLRARLRKAYPDLKIAGMRPSLFRRSTGDEQAEIVEEIKNSGAKIVFAGLGCPRQEVWTFENAPALSMPVLAVGAAFDFHAGTLSQAPDRLQKMGLEWAYRLVREPRRLWRRYVLLNPLFLALLAAQWLRLSRFDVAGKAPSQIENYA